MSNNPGLSKNLSLREFGTLPRVTSCLRRMRSVCARRRSGVVFRCPKCSDFNKTFRKLEPFMSTDSKGCFTVLE